MRATIHRLLQMHQKTRIHIFENFAFALLPQTPSDKLPRSVSDTSVHQKSGVGIRPIFGLGIRPNFGVGIRPNFGQKLGVGIRPNFGLGNWFPKKGVDQKLVQVWSQNRGRKTTPTFGLKNCPINKFPV